MYSGASQRGSKSVEHRDNSLTILHRTQKIDVSRYDLHIITEEIAVLAPGRSLSGLLLDPPRIIYMAPLDGPLGFLSGDFL